MASQSRSQREVLDALADVISVDPNGRSAVPGAPRPVPSTTYEASASSYSGQAPMSTMDSQPSVPTKDNFDPVGQVNGSRRPSHVSSNHEGSAPAVPTKSLGFGKLANAFRRHHTDEKDAKRREKERRMQRAITESSRMDVIDRMDLSGLGASLFHHDSPYDACSPHSNRHARKAPVQAFDSTIDPMTGLPIANAGARNGGAGNSAGGVGRPGLSPLAQATMRKMNDSVGDVLDDANNSNPSKSGSRSRSDPKRQLPTLGRNMTSSTTTSTAQNSAAENDSTDAGSVSSAIDRDVDAERAYRNQSYMNASKNTSRARADFANPNAEIWGMTSEPWQDFAQPANRLEPPSRGSVEGLSSAASSVFDMEAVMTGKQSSSAAAAANAGGSSSLAAPTTYGDRLSPASANGGSASDGPKRSRSLIKRIKHARQYGNVPPPDEDVVERAEAKAASQGARITSSGTRRTGPGGQHTYQHKYSPSTPPISSPAQFAGVQLTDDGAMTRSETMRAERNGFAAAQNGGGVNGNSSGTNIGRNGSIFTRFRGGKSRERDVAAAR